MDNLLLQSLNIISKLPVLVAYIYQWKKNNFKKENFKNLKPKKNYSIAENLLYMINPKHIFSRKEAELLDLSLILHAEHGGGNNSSFTNYVISSTQTDIYSSISASIGALKGPKHGGANKKVTEMIEYIINKLGKSRKKNDIKNILYSIIKKESFDKSGLIYGIGHAVYTLSDPRTIIFKKKAKELSEEKNCNDKFELLNNIENISISLLKEIKGEKLSICANVDFYSGFVYNMLKIPKELYTPLFAIARTVGWCAHRLEQVVTDSKIVRPIYKSIYDNKVYKSISDRK